MISNPDETRMKTLLSGGGILADQLAKDFCVSPGEAADSRHHFAVYEPREGRRRFLETEPCFLKVCAFKNKLLFAGDARIIRECRETFSDCDGAWFMEPASLIRLDRMLNAYGYTVDKLHPFFIPLSAASVMPDPQYEIRWYDEEAIEAFRGDERFLKAYSFCGTAPDVIGAAAVKDGAILGMAGASRDSGTMWQIGIDVVPEARGRGLGVLLVSLLKNEILSRGRLPFYGTAVSHTISQNIAIRSGFKLAWVELGTAKTG